MKKFILFPLLSMLVFLSSCNDDETVDDIETNSETETGTLRLRLEHNFDGEPFNLNEDYVTENGDTITPETLQYFLSNIKFYDNDGNKFSIPDSYHLVELEDDDNIRIMDVEGLEAGTYSGFEVSVGVDAEANTSVENASGDLNPAGADRMIWSWATGYKFILFEGEYSAVDSESGDFLYHLGHEENYKTFVFGGSDSHSEGEEEHEEEESHSHTAARLAHDEEEEESESEGGSLLIVPEDGKITEIHLMINIAELFKSPNTFSISEYSNVAGTPEPTEQLMNNIEHTTDEGHNGWFELHHVITFEE